MSDTKTASWVPHPERGEGAIKLVTSAGRTIARVWPTNAPIEPWFATWGRNGGGYFNRFYSAVERCNVWAVHNGYTIPNAKAAQYGEVTHGR